MSGSPELAERVRAIVTAHRDKRGALLPILHAIQAEFGYVDREVTDLLAAELNLSRAEVHGVISFYADFRTEPGGSTRLRLCRAEACQAVGAEDLLAHAEAVLGIKTGQTTPDGTVSLDQVFCLGNCALGPAGQLNGRLHGRLDRARLDHLLATETAGS
jgi:formate dehydrogenase subunit gamma